MDVLFAIFHFANLSLYASITLRIYHFANLLLCESITLRIYYFANLSLHASITLRLYHFTNLLLYESMTLRIYYITNLLLWAFLKVRNSEVSHPNFLWSHRKNGNNNPAYDLWLIYDWFWAHLRFPLRWWPSWLMRHLAKRLAISSRKRRPSFLHLKPSTAKIASWYVLRFSIDDGKTKANPLLAEWFSSFGKNIDSVRFRTCTCMFRPLLTI